MRKYIFLLIVVTLLIGCNREDEQIPTTQVTKVTLEPLYEKPVDLIDGENARYVKGKMEGEYLVVTVEGILNDVELISLDYDDDMNLYESDIIEHIGDLKDEVLIIETYHVEGIPSERLIWTSQNGEKGSYTFAEDGKDGLATQIFKYGKVRD